MLLSTRLHGNQCTSKCLGPPYQLYAGTILVVVLFIIHYYLNFIVRTDRRSPTGILVRCSAQTSPLFIVE